MSTRQKGKKFLLVILTEIILSSGNTLFGACHGVGYAHLDDSWRWSFNEGINKVKHTCEIQLENMRNYPDYKFSFDNPCQYEWMEIYYPEIFAEIKQRVSEGRWEPFGGMWTDPICDIPGGEEFVRQWLIGKRYLKDKFDFECKVGADLDNYSSWPGGNLPQIASKCGIKYYTFVRGLTHTNGKFFWWEANDGTRIFSHDTDFWFNCPEGNCGCSHTIPALKYYGAGNGGGGPNDRQAGNCGGADFCSRLIDFFRDAVEQGVPEETYLVDKGYCLATNGNRAAGILTHRPFIKWYNRKCACLLMEAEKFASFASRLSVDYPLEPWQAFGSGAEKETLNAYLGGCKSGESGRLNYPQQEINETLKKYLMLQHHDNLPGNFTWDGVNVFHNMYVNIYNTFKNILDTALLTIGAHVNTQGEGTPVLVFNPLSWERTGVVEVSFSEFGNPENVDVKDVDGNVVPSQVSLDREKKIVFLAKDIPPTGYKEFRIIEVDKPSAFPRTKLSVDVRKKIIENEYYQVEFDKNTGWWKRVWDKINQRELLDGLGNCLGYSDKDRWPYGSRFDEWGKDWGKADWIKVAESGPVRAKIRVKHGVIFQDTILAALGKTIDCFVHSDTYKSGGGPAYLRVVFPLNISDGTYTTEGPYGYSESPDKMTDLEKPTLSWQDLSSDRYGVSLLNDSKYGGDRDANKIKLSLISHPEFDHQEMLYSLYPHKGDWREGGTVRASYEINYPLIAKVETNHSGRLPKSYSFLRANPENIVVSVIKKHEDSRDMIVRFYETSGKRATASLVFGTTLVKAWEEDMMEWNEISPELTIVDNTTLNIDINPYEIKTLRVRPSTVFPSK